MRVSCALYGLSMARRWRTCLFWVVLLGLLAAGVLLPAPVQAEDEPPDPPTRIAEFTIDVYQYKWWVVRWKDNSIACSVMIEHEGLPTSGEILKACGASIHEDWYDTNRCTQPSLQQCQGVYLHKASEGVAQREVVIDLPPAEAWINLRGCTLQAPDNTCTDLPTLVISGLEPLPNETIVRVQGAMDGVPFSCAGSECAFPLTPTGEKGVQLEFWADSSFGDSSPHYTALVRLLPWGDFSNPEDEAVDPELYYVDIISSQWRGERAASCSETWQSLPGIGGRPDWLTTPPTVEELASDDQYYFLAGMLIQNGAVDASACPAGGLENSMAANTCGLETAINSVVEWQNQFDAEIWNVSMDTGVPARLLKNIFRRESQFWPGIYQRFKETGLGQMTDNGADVILLWNPGFYQNFCPLVLAQDTCDKGFNRLTDDQQNMLRGALVVKVNADCPTCPSGIDMSKAHFSIAVFAQTLLSNCEQVGRIIFNTTQQNPGMVADYADLWRFTLTNYNAGSGCLGDAVRTSWTRGEPLTWDNVSAHLEPACRGAIDYVEEVTDGNGLSTIPTPTEPAPTPTRAPTQTTPQPDPDSFEG